MPIHSLSNALTSLVSTVNANDKRSQLNSNNEASKKCKLTATHSSPKQVQNKNSTNANNIATAIHEVTSSIKMVAAATTDLQKVQNTDLPLTDHANNSRRKRNRVENKNIELEEFRRKYLGIDPALSVDQHVGKLTNTKTTHKSPPEPPQQAAPPTATELRTTGFG
jgi:hypothetical protein